MKTIKAKVLIVIFVGLIFLLLACGKNNETEITNETTEENDTKLYKNSYSDNTVKDKFYNLQYIVPAEWDIVDKSEGMYSYRDDINGVGLYLMYIGEANNATELLEETWRGIKEGSLKERYEWSEDKYNTSLHNIHGIFGEGKVKLEQWDIAENFYTFIFASENELYMVFMHVSNNALYDYIEDFYRFLNTIKIEDEQETEIETTTQLPQLINKGEFTTDGREESDTKQPTSEQQTSNLSEGIVYQDENVIIKYAGLSIEKYNRGYVINFLIENLSSKTLTIQLRETSINGYMASPIMSIEIAPNKKAMDGAKIVNEEAEKFPMDNIKNIETKFHIFNSNDWEDYYETENIVVFDKD